MNKNNITYDLNSTIHEIFERQVELTPEKDAILFKDEKLTYRELNNKANKLARVLRNNGVQRNQIVCLMVERSIDMMIGILAILKSGGAYLIIDPEYPESRINYMLQDSEADIVLTQHLLKDKLEAGRTILCIDDLESYDENEDNLENLNNEKDLMYIVYTSGSTGKPKAAMAQHRNIINITKHLYDSTDIDFSGRVQQYCTTSFAFSYAEIFSTLLIGGQLHIVDSENRLVIEKQFNFIEKNKINVVFWPVSFLKLISREEKYINKIPKIINHIIVAGEQLALTDKFINYIKSNNITLHNHYGTSETHTAIAYTLDLNAEIKPLNKIPIGKSINNMKAYIIDENFKIKDVGEVGELCLAGYGVGCGYYNKPELTSHKFIPNPYDDGEILYRTGDLCKVLADGNIDIVGRVDHQVKIRGYRVEIGEVEFELLKNSLIKEVVIVAKETEDHYKYLCAYFTSEVEVDINEVKENLRKALPEYMIPTYFIKLDEMPKTLSKKIDRTALMDFKIEVEDAQSNEEKVLTEKNTIYKLKEILINKLKLKIQYEKINVDTNLENLGIDSISYIKLMGYIEEEFGLELELDELDINKFKNLQQLSVFVEDKVI